MRSAIFSVENVRSIVVEYLLKAAPAADAHGAGKQNPNWAPMQASWKDKLSD
jgi:hypothetical protein